MISPKGFKGDKQTYPPIKATQCLLQKPFESIILNIILRYLIIKIIRLIIKIIRLIIKIIRLIIKIIRLIIEIIRLIIKIISLIIKNNLVSAT